MNKNYKTLALLLLIANVFTCFMPVYFYREKWEYLPSIVYHGHAQQTKLYGCSMFEIGTEAGPTLACFVLLCWVACIIIILISIIKNIEKNYIYVLPWLCFIPFLFLYNHMDSAMIEYGSYYFRYSVNWMFYVSLALQLAASVIMLIAKTTRESTPQAIAKVALTGSTVEELKHYKDLLDSGIISQEEFDNKKKQALEL